MNMEKGFHSLSQPSKYLKAVSVSLCCLDKHHPISSPLQCGQTWGGSEVYWLTY